MPMSETLLGLRALSDEELIKRHDEAAVHIVVGTEYFLTELARREASRNAHSVRNHTVAVTWLTVAIAAMTLVNVAIFAWSVLREP